MSLGMSGAFGPVAVEDSWWDELGETERAAALSRGTLCDVQPGWVLTSEAVPGREAFLVLEGQARVSIGGHIVARVGRGGLVGEMALTDHGPRSATVVAATPMKVLAFGPRGFATFVARPEVARAVCETLAIRLRGTLRRWRCSS